MYASLKTALASELEEIRQSGLWKTERIISSEQGPEIRLADGRRVLNFCANNYLGLSGAQWLVEAAHRTLEHRGYGMSSVRFICGTLDLHRELEQKIARFVGLDDAILFAACFDANGGVFEPLLAAEDAIITDQLNHASIIDGIRLCKAQRHIYKHADMSDLEDKLGQTQSARRRMVATDGVFSMDGDIAPLAEICRLADQYDALVMIDDCHATGFMGKTGRGTHEHRGVMDRVDIITGTLGKALGGASGGFIASHQEIIDLMRQRSRPYLFSNTLAPSIAGTSIAVFDRLSETTELRDRLEENTRQFRGRMTTAGFEIRPGEHPIVPIMLYDAVLSQKMADALLDEGIFVIGFFYPVVPKGQARIRVQVSAAHTREQLDRAVDAFTKVGKKLGVIS
ncbi:MAG: glycine C-acetyltransferase [Acidobacteriota bacterium]|nr:MAG: glycine C-acetyltransferase [Acidobacteriota bacterium]